MTEHIRRSDAIALLEGFKSRCERAAEQAQGYEAILHMAGAAAANSLKVAFQLLEGEDIKPERRGRWVYNSPDDNIPYCSECLMPQDSECNYCPSCGAYMKGRDGS